jgi:DNA-directed RNA polymerase specialized sigma24 family protein
MDLLQRFTHGEIDAFELVRQFQGEIYAWTVRIVRDPGVAEDLTVETLWRVYRARHQFRPDGNFGAFARRIATTWRSTICGAAGRRRVSRPSLQEYRSLILWYSAKPRRGSSRRLPRAQSDPRVMTAPQLPLKLPLQQTNLLHRMFQGLGEMPFFLLQQAGPARGSLWLCWDR